MGVTRRLAQYIAGHVYADIPSDVRPSSSDLKWEDVLRVRYCVDKGDYSKSLHPGFAAMRGVMVSLLVERETKDRCEGILKGLLQLSQSDSIRGLCDLLRSWEADRRTRSSVRHARRAARPTSGEEK